MIYLSIPAEDDTVDSEIMVLTDSMVETNIGIQDARSYGGGFVVNEYAPKGTPDAEFWVRTISEARTLKRAKEIVEAHISKQTKGESK